MNRYPPGHTKFDNLATSRFNAGVFEKEFLHSSGITVPRCDEALVMTAVYFQKFLGSFGNRKEIYPVAKRYYLILTAVDYQGRAAYSV